MMKGKPSPGGGAGRRAGLEALGIAGLIALGAILLVTAVSPRMIFASVDAALQARELQQNQARWESHHITHYRMSLTFWGLSWESVDDYDRMPLQIEVKNHEVVSVVDALGARWATDYPLASKGFTIPRLFSLTSDWIWNKPVSIGIEYHPNLGLPTEVTVDPFEEPCCQFMGYRLESFEELRP